MRIFLTISSICCFLFFSFNACTKKGYIAPVIDPVPNVQSDVQMWLTRGDQSTLFRKQGVSLVFKAATNNYPTITVDAATTYQKMDGFGYTLTHGSAYLINQMAAPQQAALLHELFGTDSASIGISYLRISIGASDLSATVFSCNDLPTGQTDPDLAQFSLQAEEADLIPLLKKIIAIRPDLKIMATPWSAPVWMKTNGSSVGGSLKTIYYDAYARYFVRYITGMQAKGIAIEAITPQNEPQNPNNNPSMLMTAQEQAKFIGENLGPAFQAAGLKTKIVTFDHNCDDPGYPLAVFADAGANPFVDGAAFHLYAGNIDKLGQVHAAYPNKNLYFTEQYTDAGGTFGGDLAWHTRNLTIGAAQNWSKTVLEWNLANDAGYGPHTPGGCTTCKGALTISGNNIVRNVSYYIIAHASKFVVPGAVRIASNTISNLPNVAFQCPDGKKVLIVLNDGNASQSFNIAYSGKVVTPNLEPGAVATFVW